MTPIEKVERFLQRADALRHSRVVESGFTVEAHLVLGGPPTAESSLQQPDEEELRSFLLTFRQFISENEPVYLPHVLNLCERHIADNSLRLLLRDARQSWLYRLKHDGIGLSFGGRAVTPEHITDLWINGEYFHNDEAKRRELYSLAPHQFILSRHKFLSHLITATEHICYVAAVIRKALGAGSFHKEPCLTPGSTGLAPLAG